MRRAPRVTLFPYTTLFRSVVRAGVTAECGEGVVHVHAAVGRQHALGLFDDHAGVERDRKSTRLNSSHANKSYAGFCLKKKNLGRAVEDVEDVAEPVHRARS